MEVKEKAAVVRIIELRIEHSLGWGHWDFGSSWGRGQWDLGSSWGKRGAGVIGIMAAVGVEDNGI